LSCEKALSSGARIVNPPDFVANSCELSWLINCVVFMSRIRTLNDFAFLRIPTMSTAPELSGVESLGASGNEGTNGLGAAAGVVGAGNVGCIGAAAGDNWDKVVVVEYKREISIASENDKR